MSIPTHVVFLRGINVGGNKKVPMATLKKVLESLGYINVKTLLASGNVLLSAGKDSPNIIKKKIENAIVKEFGFGSDVIVRTVDQMQQLMKSDPFKNIKVDEHTRLYVTFLSEKPKSSLAIPYASPEKDFQILRVTDTEVCSVLQLNPKKKSTDAMNVLEKEFGKNSCRKG